VRNGTAAAVAAGGALVAAVPVLGTPTATGAVADDVYVRSAAAEIDGVRMVASVVPVTTTRDPVPPGVDVSDLVKAAGLHDAARALEDRRAAARCAADLGGLGPVKPWVRDAARFLSCLYDEPDLIGVARRGRVSEHPRGLAVDLMTRGERGDRIAECALENQDELGVDYVIWKQRVNHGDGWERMADRGGTTENHYDHVHISFERGGADGTPAAERCG
jgi:hypothetical protein